MRLASMEVSDMIDVIHYFFEEDTLFVSSEQLAYKDSFRVNMYRDLYNSEYRYATRTKTGSTGLEALDGPFDSYEEPVQEEKIKVFSPREKTAKPYIPPTTVSADDIKPFGSVLDAPIN